MPIAIVIIGRGTIAPAGITEDRPAYTTVRDGHRHPLLLAVITGGNEAAGSPSSGVRILVA